MATKWKNTIEKIAKNVFSKKGRRILLSILCAIFASIFFYYVHDSAGWRATEDIWPFGLLGNLFLGIAYRLVYQLYLDNSYRNRVTADRHTYDNWKRFFQRQQLFLGILTLLLLCAASLYFRWITVRHYYVVNYASGYVAFFTALCLFLVMEFTVIRFLHRQLDIIMSQTQEANQKIVDAAIEAERQSIEAAIKSEKLKVDLISNVSHDLKTPLTSMTGYIDLMKKEDLSDTMADYVEVLSAKALKLKEMIESLFSLAKTSSGNIELHPEPLSLNRMVEQIYGDMEDKILASGLEFVTELTAADTELVTDSSYLYRICQNLIDNALKYSASHTRVFLKTVSTQTESGRSIRFEVTNTSGYRMNFTKEQIVERFARGDESRTTEGNGLGLAIVNTYTAALGGKFDVNIDCDQFKAIVTLEKEMRI